MHATSIIVGQRHKRAVLIANTKYIPLCQHLAEVFISSNLTPLVQQSIQRLLALWMRVNQHERVSLPNDLQVLPRNILAAHHDIICAAAPNIGNWLIERMDALLTGGVAANLQRGDTEGSKRGNLCRFWMRAQSRQVRK